MSHSAQLHVRMRYRAAVIASVLLLNTAASVHAQVALPLATIARAQVRLQQIMLLREPAMVKEIALTEDQVDQVNQWIKEFTESQREMAQGMQQGTQDMQPDDIQRLMVDFIKRLDSKVTQLYGRMELLLDDKQMARVKQVSLQMRGVDGLDEPEVMDAIGLSDDQKQQLRDIRQDHYDKQQKLMQAMMREEDAENAEQTLVEMESEIETRFLAVLTRPQLDAFAKLKGPKFNR